MQTITYGISVKSTKTSISIPDCAIEVAGTDYVEAEVKPGVTDLVVVLQPGEAKAVRLLVIKSSSYGDHLEFKVNDGAATDSKVPVKLDGPLIFSGGAVALFDVAPKRLKFTNTGTKPDQTAKVEIFVGRDATT